MSKDRSARIVPYLSARIGAAVLASSMLVLAPLSGIRGAAADEPVTLSITIKDHKFDPPELHAPPGKQISIRVKNLNDIVSEFESGDLHFEKIVPSGSEITVYVRPQQPGRYNFYDDFHHETQGYLVVP